MFFLGAKSSKKENCNPLERQKDHLKKRDRRSAYKGIEIKGGET
jgi:hypothetical protein